MQLLTASSLRKSHRLHSSVRRSTTASLPITRPNILYSTFPDLIAGYLETLEGRPSHQNMCAVAGQWINNLTEVPTRAQILDRHKAKGHGHYQPGACQANTELTLMRAAFRWGIYTERWAGNDPTTGVKKWKRAKRKRVSKVEEIKKLLAYFTNAKTDLEIRDRALFGLMLFTGCRPSEARTAKLDAIQPYGEMGCWTKGKTKNGEDYEVPVPSHYLPWLNAWLAIRPMDRHNPYLFPGRDYQKPLTADMVGLRWHDLRLIIGLHGLWNYDLRRSLATHMSNELNESDAKIDAILGHAKTSSLGHYLHVSFDAMTGPIQHYAEWLSRLSQYEQQTIQQPSLFQTQEVRA